jgi:HAD superfamily hydrolase (TIGR01490 family)
MRIAIFDFDGTLVQKDTLPVLLRCWKMLGYSRAKRMKAEWAAYSHYALYKSKIKPSFDRVAFKVKAMDIFTKMLEGMTKQQVEDYMHKCAHMLTDEFYPPCMEAVEKDRQDGYKLVLLSGTFYPFIKAVGDRLGFDFVFASDLIYDQNGYVDPNRPMILNLGKKKQTTIVDFFANQSVDWAQSKAYADGYSDIDILEQVGLSVAVNPDQELLAYAKSNGWKII